MSDTFSYPKQFKRRKSICDDTRTNIKINSNITPSGYLLTCDRPCKEFIKHLDASKSADKKFILEDLDPTHLLVRKEAKQEILNCVESWSDKNIFENLGNGIGENLETS